jgi:hypothetical protein
MCGDDPYWSGAGAELGVFRIFLVNDRGTRGLSKSGSTDQKSRLVKAWEAFKVEKFDVRNSLSNAQPCGKGWGNERTLEKKRVLDSGGVF